jgi:dTDP-4-dehydrorhamnose reductase
MKTLIIGSNGIFRSCLSKTFPYAVKLTQKDLNITKRTIVVETIRQIRPDLVINTIAYTDIDSCENNQEMAFLVNGYGPGYIAEACTKIGAKLVHFSTDYASDTLTRKCTKSESQNQGIYRHSRLLGEKNIVENMKDYRIIRMSDFFEKEMEDFANIGKNDYTPNWTEKIREIIRFKPGVYKITNKDIYYSQRFASDINNKVLETSEIY